MEKIIDKIAAHYHKFNLILGGVLAIYALGTAIYKGIGANSTSALLYWTMIGVFGALFIVLTFVALDFGLIILDNSTDWLSQQVRKYPSFRRWLLFPATILAFVAAYFIIRYLQTELSLRIIIAVYLAWVLPSALFSLIQDDMRRERTRLSGKISREIRIQNPQAAVENAFTHFEDHLLKRVSGDSTLYGNRLIKTAYEGENSKLVFKSDGKDYTTNLYNLMSGAYSIFRNPRHHKIINDDEQKAQALISLAELLIEFIDLSDERENKP